MYENLASVYALKTGVPKLSRITVFINYHPKSSAHVIFATRFGFAICMSAVMPSPWAAQEEIFCVKTYAKMSIFQSAGTAKKIIDSLESFITHPYMPSVEVRKR